MSLTACGLAWPRVARMTWPTKNLKTPSLPDLNLATLSGFFSMTSRAACSMASSADLRAEAFGGDNFRGGAAGFKHGGENFFADGGGDFPGLDECDEFGESCWGDRAGVDFLAGIVQTAQKFGLHPVGGGFAGSAGFHDGFKIIGEDCVSVRTSAS